MKKKGLLAAIAAVALFLSLTISAVAGPVGAAAGFEDDDGNLVDNTPLFVAGPPATGDIDWNNFTGFRTWTGTEPDRTATGSLNGWTFTGLEDAQAVTTDDAFAGGTKQNKDCATLITQKADNKADLKRIYLASKTLDSGTKAGHVILTLAWVRIPQNTTAPSAHVAFEFNQNETACTGPGHDGLVPRSSANGGDLLVLYDFEGGTDIPVISISRWTGSDWTAPVALTTGQAEAKVNTGSTAVDTVAPTTETLGIKEFGEAGIDLTAAGVFPATPTSCLTFGHAFGVTRTSGNSNTAQMKDIVGPADVNISNCATVIIRKVTDPTGDATTSFSYTTNVTTLPATTTSPFSLKDGEHNAITNVVAGSGKTVTEADPGPGYSLTSIDCDASTVPAANRSPDTTTGTVTFSIAAGETLDCTYTNTKQTGALMILKQSTKSGNPLVSVAGAVFSYDGSSVTDNGTDGDEDSTIGEVCVSGLATGDYTVNETSPPDGYGGASQTDVTATVVAGTDCTDNLPAASDVATFTNAPLADIQVNFRDGGSGETTTGSTIECVDGGGTDLGANDATATDTWDKSETHLGLEPGTYTCTIVIDP
jgi:hypothetical protein